MISWEPKTDFRRSSRLRTRADADAMMSDRGGGVSWGGVEGAGGVEGPMDCTDCVVSSDCVAMMGVDGPRDCVVSRDCVFSMGVEGPRGLLLPARLPESALVKYEFCLRGPRGIRCRLVTGLSCMSFSRGPCTLLSPETMDEVILPGGAQNWR